jgi:inosine-uridine nucleoside N-ribohydrolase
VQKLKYGCLKNSKMLQEVYVVGGHISRNTEDKGNVFSIPSNQYAEFNMFLDPLAAKTVFESEVNITLIPLSTQRRVSSFATVIGRLNETRKTPEVVFSKRLLSSLHRLKQIDNRYHHMV